LSWNRSAVDRKVMQGYITEQAGEGPQPEARISVDKFANVGSRNVFGGTLRILSSRNCATRALLGIACSWRFAKLQETIRKCSDIAKNCFADETHRVERTQSGVRVSRPAGIGQYHGNKSQICGVTHGRLNADFECDTDDGDTRNIAIAEGKRQGSAFECRHREFVEDQFVIVGLKFWNDGGCWRVA
jgi:hypothetical protein